MVGWGLPVAWHWKVTSAFSCTRMSLGPSTICGLSAHVMRQRHTSEMEPGQNFWPVTRPDSDPFHPVTGPGHWVSVLWIERLFTPHCVHTQLYDLSCSPSLLLVKGAMFSSAFVCLCLRVSGNTQKNYSTDFQEISMGHGRNHTFPLPQISSNFVDNFLNYLLTDKQTRRQKHHLPLAKVIKKRKKTNRQHKE